jgi:hypothetical protein
MNRALILGATLAFAALWWWSWEPTPAATGTVQAQPAVLPGAKAAAALAAPNNTGATRAPFRAQGTRERATQIALWQERLARATQTLDAYREHTRYPPGSRRASQQPDQLRPYEPVTEDHALKKPGESPDDSVKLRTTQERIFLQGDESTRITLSLVDNNGQVQPLRVLRAAVREITPNNQGSLFPNVPVAFNDEGADGDAAAGDRVHSARLQPSAQGFAGLSGQLRLEVHLEHRGANGLSQGFTYFDVYVTALPPATWAGAVRESTDGGSLNFDLPVQVREPGRYVVTGVVDDAAGKPYAHLTYNDVLPAGSGRFRLMLFGKLMHDAPPAFPLVLRDVVAFRLREEGHPDRLLMPQRAGRVHVSARHALTSFSNDEWTDDARQRYLAELMRDVEDAKRRLDSLGGS